MADPNDSTIILNRGVGGDTTDSSTVNPTDAALDPAVAIKRERVVIGGDSSRDAVIDLPLENAVSVLPVSATALAEKLDTLITLQKKQLTLLMLIYTKTGGKLSIQDLEGGLTWE